MLRVRYLSHQVKKRKTRIFLPDDILINIIHISLHFYKRFLHQTSETNKQIDTDNHNVTNSFMITSTKLKAIEGCTRLDKLQ